MEVKTICFGDCYIPGSEYLLGSESLLCLHSATLVMIRRMGLIVSLEHWVF